MGPRFRRRTRASTTPYRAIFSRRAPPEPSNVILRSSKNPTLNHACSRDRMDPSSAERRGSGPAAFPTPAPGRRRPLRMTSSRSLVRTQQGCMRGRKAEKTRHFVLFGTRNARGRYHGAWLRDDALPCQGQGEYSTGKGPNDQARQGRKRGREEVEVATHHTNGILKIECEVRTKNTRGKNKQNTILLHLPLVRFNHWYQRKMHVSQMGEKCCRRPSHDQFRLPMVKRLKVGNKQGRRHLFPTATNNLQQIRRQRGDRRSTTTYLGVFAPKPLLV